MAAVQSQVSDGTLNIVNVGIPYFEQDDVALALDNGVDAEVPLIEGVDYNWTSATSIQFIAGANAPGGFIPNGITVFLRRTTDSDEMLNVYDGGAPFSRTTLDENFEQLLFLAQEFAGTSGLDAVEQLRAALLAASGATTVGATLNAVPTTVQGAINGLDTAVDTEVTDRIADVNAEEAARIAAIAAEVTARNSAITTAINTEVTNRNTAILLATGSRTPEQYGAVGDGVTNDTVAVQAALTAAGATRGGSVMLSKRYLCDSSITIPENTRLIGTWNPYGSLPWQTTVQVHDYASTLILNTAATVNLSAGANVENLSILRKGMTVAELAVTNFGGTAITGQGSGSAPFEMDGVVLRGLQIIGFNQAIRLDLCPRAIIEYVSGDCVNGISIGTTFDVLRMKNCHFWPFSTIGAGGTGAAFNRTGTAYNFTARNDIAHIDNCFSYGYFRGFNLTATVGTCTFTNCAADGTAVNTITDSRGFFLTGNTTFCTFIGCVAYSNDYGLWSANDVNDSIVWTNCRFIGNKTDAVHCVSGSTRLVGCTLALSVSGLVPVNSTTSVYLDGCTFTGNTGNDIAGVSSPVVYVAPNCKFDNLTAIGGWNTQNLVSGDPLALPRNGNFFVVTGSTAFGNLDNGWAGRRVTLQFDAGLTVFNSAVVGVKTMHLNGGANFVTTQNDILELIHNGRFWSECCRSVNP